jgi:hypothetical protein
MGYPQQEFSNKQTLIFIAFFLALIALVIATILATYTRPTMIEPIQTPNYLGTIFQLLETTL